MIRRMQLLDIKSVVLLHLSTFSGFFLSFLGFNFLKCFYQAVLKDEASIALVFDERKYLSGFVVGTSEPEGFYKRTLVRDWPRLMFASILPVLKQPTTVLRLARRLVMVRKESYEPNEALLMSIAVTPSSQERGIGRQLLESFLVEAKQKGASIVSLTTDKLGNDRVNQFYLHAGFTCSRSFSTSEGRQMNLYTKDLYRDA